MSEYYEINYNIIREILVNAHSLCKKKALKSPYDDVSLDLITILQSYTEVLKAKNIDTSKDTGYYKFLLDLSVENNKLRNPDWFSCFEKLQRRYEKRRIAFSQYNRGLLYKALSSLYGHMLHNKHTKSQDFKNLTIIQKPSKNNSFVRSSIHHQDTIHTIKRAIDEQDTFNLGNNHHHSDFSHFYTREKASRPSHVFDFNGSDKENSQIQSQSEQLSFIEDSPEKDRSSIFQSRPCLVPLDVNTMNHSNNKINTSYVSTHTPQLGKYSTERYEKERKGSNTIDFTTNRVSKTTALDSASSNLMKTKESTGRMDRALEALMAKEKDIDMIPRESLNIMKTKESTGRMDRALEAFMEKDRDIERIQRDSSHLMKSKESSGRMDRALEALMAKDKDIEMIHREISQVSEREPVMSKEESLKIMNQVFFKWSYYAQKKRNQKIEKEKNLKHILKAMEYHYQTQLTKGFIALGFFAINQKKYRDQYRIIKDKHDLNVKRNMFKRYKTAYGKHVIKGMLKEKAGKLNDKKILQRQLKAWKETANQRIKTIKPFQSIWQPRVLIYMLCNLHKIDINLSDHEILGKIAQKMHVPPSREKRIMNAISMLNEHTLKKSFAFWRVYKQKCFESR